MTFHFDSPEESGNDRDLGVHGNRSRKPQSAGRGFEKIHPEISNGLLVSWWFQLNPSEKYYIVKLEISSPKLGVKIKNM